MILPRAIWIRLVLYPVLIYGGLLLTVYLRQYRILYLAEPLPRDRADRDLEVSGLRRWPADAAPDFLGLVSAGDGPQPARGVAVVFHGNAGWAADRAFFRDALERRGLRVVLAEYPAYGGRGGRLGEASLVADGIRTVRAAARDFGRPLYLWGESLGSGVATAVAAETTDTVDGIALITPWDSLPSVARHYYPYLPTRWLSRDRYDNIRNLRHFRKPVAILLCEFDQVVPPQFGRRLYDALTHPKRVWVFPDADHNTWPAAPGLDWWDAVMAFLEHGGESGHAAD